MRQDLRTLVTRAISRVYIFSLRADDMRQEVMPRNCQDLQGQLGGDEVVKWRMRMLPLAARGGEVGQNQKEAAAT